MSRELPILFNGEMVRAILAGKKTQTRRPISVRGYKSVSEFGRSDAPGYAWHFRRPDGGWCDLREEELVGRAPCAVGDTLWVKETFAYCMLSFDVCDEATSVSIPAKEYQFDCKYLNSYHLVYRADPDNEPIQGKWVPSILMPRRAARLFLEVVSVRAARGADISEEDARAEGFADAAEFIRAWAEIYGSRDGWCWVIGFKVEEATR